jgi:hypothetical protein
MRSFVALTLFVSCVLLGVACEDTEDTQEPSPSAPVATLAPTPEPTQTSSIGPGVTPPQIESFRAFAGGIEQAITTRDPSLIRQSALVSEYECDGSRLLELDVCLDPSGAIMDGTVVTGVYAALLNSDFGTLRSTDEVARRFEAFARDGDSSLTDADGSGEARLYALTYTQPAPQERPTYIPGYGPVPGKDVYQAVLTSIPGAGVDAQTWPAGDRVCYIYRFFREDTQWRLFEEAVGACDGWHGTDRCDWCYDYWEPWTD